LHVISSFDSPRLALSDIWSKLEIDDIVGSVSFGEQYKTGYIFFFHDRNILLAWNIGVQQTLRCVSV